MLNHQFIRFLLVGVINTLFGYGIYAFLVLVGVHFALAALLSTILGVLFNFKTTGALVFKSNDNQLIIKFFVVYGILYLLNVAGIYVLSTVNVNHQAGGAIMLLPMAILGFVLNKYYVFNQKKN